MVEMVTKLPIKTEGVRTVPTYETHRPWYPMESLRRGFDRLFGDSDMGFWPTPFRRSLSGYEPEMGFTKGPGIPAVDVREKADGYAILVEMPGVDEKDIEVKLVNGGLLIKGEKKEEKKEVDAGYMMSERHFGTFERFFGVPDGVDLDKIVATYAKGVLTVTLPKTREAKLQERKIAVKAA